MSDEVFNTFRSHPIYTKILEHVSEKQGHAYLREFAADGELMDFIRDFAPSSLRGGPSVADFGLGHPVSPTLLRYAKVLADLRKLFGPLDGHRIVEVGVGYGGQCQIICGVQDIAEYRLVDLPEVLDLAKKWLEPYRKASSMHFVDALSEIEHSVSDLFISNYAFSEIERPGQEVLIESLVSRARSGYVTYNHIAGGRDVMSAAEFSERVGGEIHAEVPLTHKDNCIVVWGANRV